MAPGSQKRVDVPRDIVVIGASAGGVEALTTIVEGLTADFRGAVHIVLHLREGTHSFLRDILARVASLPVHVAADGEDVRHGAICVAPPDRHLFVEDGHVRSLRAPKANGVRPSADILFQSAALAYGPRVVGVVLTGALDDGTLGLRAIKRRGGVAVVQSDALHRGMPTSAIRNVDVDFELPLREIAPRLTMLVEEGEEAMSPEQTGANETELEVGYEISGLHEPPGAPSVLRCPECGGALWEHVDGDVTGFSCHVGHAYSADSLLEEHGDALERAIWTAVRMLEERASLFTRLAERMEQGGVDRSRERFEQKARLAEAQADIMRRSLLASEAGPAA